MQPENAKSTPSQKISLYQLLEQVAIPTSIAVKLLQHGHLLLLHLRSKPDENETLVRLVLQTFCKFYQLDNAMLHCYLRHCEILLTAPTAKLKLDCLNVLSVIMFEHYSTKLHAAHQLPIYKNIIVHLINSGPHCDFGIVFALLQCALLYTRIEALQCNDPEPLVPFATLLAYLKHDSPFVKSIASRCIAEYLKHTKMQSFQITGLFHELVLHLQANMIMV